MLFWAHAPRAWAVILLLLEVFHNIVVLRKSLTAGNWCIIFYSETFAKLLYWMYDCDVKNPSNNAIAGFYIKIGLKYLRTSLTTMTKLPSYSCTLSSTVNLSPKLKSLAWYHLATDQHRDSNPWLPFLLFSFSDYFPSPKEPRLWPQGVVSLSPSLPDVGRFRRESPFPRLEKLQKNIFDHFRRHNLSCNDTSHINSFSR